MSHSNAAARAGARSSRVFAGSRKVDRCPALENLSDEKQNAYFAEGIQDEILTRLSEDRRPEGDLTNLDSEVQKRA